MRRRRSSARKQGTAPWTALAALLAGALAAWQAPWLTERTSGRTPLDPDRYTLWVPGAAAAGGDFAQAAWSGIADGELILQPRAFGLAERLTFNRPELTELELRFAAGSPPISFTGRTAGGGPATLGTLKWEGAVAPRAGTVPWATPGVARIQFGEGQAFADGTALGASTPFADLAPEGTARLAGITLRGAGGAILLEDSFRSRPTPLGRLGWALLAAAAAAAFAAAIQRRGGTPFGRVVVGLSLLLPAWVLATRYGEWASWLEATRLVGIDVGTVRRLALALSLLPGTAGILLLTDALEASQERPAPPAPVRLAVTAALVLAATRSFDLEGGGLVCAAALAAAVPWRVARAANLPPGAAWWRDLPAGLVAAAFGLGAGLPLALAWRALGIVQDAPLLLKRGAAGAGVNGLLVLGLLSPVAAEALARVGPLRSAWSAESLTGASIGAPTAPSAFTPFSDQRCGAGDPLVVVSFGGSSTGGAWQFRGRPDAFFPARLHETLCAQGLAVRSLNYGDSGRDSFDIAEAAEATLAALPPDVVVLYLGVNDLLTVDSPLTRRQRHEALEARSAATGRLAAMAAESRLLTAAALLLRGSDPRPLVPAVPVEDAEANVRRVIAAAGTAGAHSLLVPELATNTFAPALRPYAEMLARVAATSPAATYVNPAEALGPGAATLLADRNHLTPEGATALAQGLAPVVVAIERAE